MANKTFNDLKKIKVSDIEFQLEKPNYTIDTINKLSEDFPGQPIHIDYRGR